MPPKRATGGRKKNAAAFEMAEPFARGIVLTDLGHKTWTISDPIGQGGFGCLYECRNPTSKTTTYVVKVEPDSNGPLFCEMHFYLQLGKKTLQDTFIKANRLDHLGVPQLISHGMHVSTSTQRRYRFLIIPKYKQTLAVELQLTNTGIGHCLTEKRVQSLGKQMLDIFEFIHSHGYVHADVKAENILMNDTTHIFLLDYGLSRKVTLQYEEKVQRRHEGTLEFTSLDVHRGAAPSFRGDLEILFYNMLHWLGARLPWLTITDGVRVQQAKITARSDPAGFVISIFPKCAAISAKMRDALTQFFREIISMEYTDKGDYRRLREIITGQSRQRRSSIGAVATSTSKRVPLIDLENDEEEMEEGDDDKTRSRKKPSPRRAATATTKQSAATRARSASRDGRKSRTAAHSRSPSPPIQISSARTPTLNMLNALPVPTAQRSKSKYHNPDDEEDENDIDMSAILNPKLSSTRIERPRRVHAPPPISTNDRTFALNTRDMARVKLTNGSPLVRPNIVSTENTTRFSAKREHSDIIEKVLAGVPLSDDEIRQVIHRPKTRAR